jgi:hypothetical protein
MILLLRHRHRQVFAVLGVLLPLLLATGIAARRKSPQLETLPPELSPQTTTFTATEYERDDLFGESPVQVRLWREQETGRLAAGFGAPKNFPKPDLMAYWSAAQPPAGKTLPAEARLLGAFIAGPLALPAEASTTGGCLILFSLANQEIVAVSKPVRFDDSTK